MSTCTMLVCTPFNGLKFYCSYALISSTVHLDYGEDILAAVSYCVLVSSDLSNGFDKLLIDIIILLLLCFLIFMCLA